MLAADSFKDVKVLVVGDVMLDRYWFGSVERISPEAPVPVVSVHDFEHRAGGAANVAVNVSALGAKCTLISVVGDDEPGRQLLSILQQSGIESNLFVHKQAETTVKLRILSRNQQLLRADFEKHPDTEALEACLDQYERCLTDADVVLISDYGKGGLRHISDMITSANNEGKTVIVDPKGVDFSRYANASMITPNTNELEQVVGRWVDEGELEAKAKKLIRDLHIDSLLVTKSEHGMSLYYADSPSVHREAMAKDVYDVSGAGDTVISTCAVALGAGLSNEEMLRLANTAAGIVVGKIGTATANSTEIIENLDEKI